MEALCLLVLFGGTGLITVIMLLKIRANTGEPVEEAYRYLDQAELEVLQVASLARVEELDKSPQRAISQIQQEASALKNRLADQRGLEHDLLQKKVDALDEQAAFEQKRAEELSQARGDLTRIQHALRVRRRKPIK